MNFFSINQRSLTSRLTATTLFYLAFPNLLFLFCWLRQPFNFFAAGLLFLVTAALLVRAFRSESPVKQSSQNQSDVDLNTGPKFWKQVSYTFLPLLIFSFFSGVGGFGFQLSDWEKHNSMLRDLMVQPWPVHYGNSEGLNSTLIYYFAYYLPAALVGKVLGWDVANCALLGWSILGLLLLSIWLTIFVGKKIWWLGLAFILFNSYDFIGFHIDNLLMWGRIQYGIGFEGDHLRHLRSTWKWEFAPFNGSWFVSLNNTPLSFTSVTTSFLYVPQHSLPAWLGAAILLRNQFSPAFLTELPRRNSFDTAIDCLTVPLLILWSAFISIGCLPILLIKFILNWKVPNPVLDCTSNYEKNDKWLLVLIYSSALSVMGITVLFFLGKQSDGEFGFSFLLRPMFSGNHAFQLFKYFVFLMVSLVLPALLIWRSFKLFPERVGSLKPYFWLSIVLLILIPYVGYGMNNDFTLRASMPILFVFRLYLLYFAALLFVAQGSKALSKPYRQNRFAFQLMALCGIFALGDLGYRNAQQWQNRPDFKSVPSLVRLYEREEFRAYRTHLYAQYLGNLNKTLFR
jgi:hypothetical protein